MLTSVKDLMETVKSIGINRNLGRKFEALGRLFDGQDHFNYINDMEGLVADYVDVLMRRCLNIPTPREIREVKFSDLGNEDDTYYVTEFASSIRTHLLEYCDEYMSYDDERPLHVTHSCDWLTRAILESILLMAGSEVRLSLPSRCESKRALARCLRQYTDTQRIGFKLRFTVFFPPDELTKYKGEITVNAPYIDMPNAASEIQAIAFKSGKSKNTRISLSFDMEGKKTIPCDYKFMPKDEGREIYGRILRIQWLVQDAPSQIKMKLMLQDGRLEFVNRRDALSKLVELYNQTYTKKISSSNSGTEWTYPICANEYGSGKSTLGERFLHILNADSDKTKPYAVLPILKNAVYVPISFRNLTGPDKCDPQSFIQLLCDTLSTLIVDASYLDDLPRTSVLDFIEALMYRSDRALFIFLDEIDAPFHHVNEDFARIQEMQMSQFQQFITGVVSPLLKSSALVFVLLSGRAPFLDWIGATPNARPLIQGGGRVAAQRISLNMIRPDMIIKILEGTFCQSSGDASEITLDKFLNLTTAKSLEQYAKGLYELTAGHPRTLVEVLLARCKSINSGKVPAETRPQFENPDEGKLSDTVVAMIQRTAMRFSKSTKILIDECKKGESSILNMESIDGIKYLDLLPSLRIGYQALANGMAQLTIPRRIQLVLEVLLSPLIDFLLSVSRMKDCVPVNFSQAMEIVVAKSFMEWFPETDRNATGIQAMFGSTKLAQWSGLFCGRSIKTFPKVTSASSGSSETAPTIHPKNVSGTIGAFMEENEGGDCWLIPAQMSSSPDLIHVSVCNSEKRIVLVAVKNYSNSSKLSESGIAEEIKKAVPMVPKGCHAVLVIAATQYTQDIQKRFENGNSVFVLDKIPHKGIEEVIVLDLTTKEKRATFFHVTGNKEAANGLEMIVEKTMKRGSRPSAALESPPQSKRRRNRKAYN